MESPEDTQPESQAATPYGPARGPQVLATASGTLATSVSVLVAALVAGMALSRALGPVGRGEVAALLLWGSTAFDIGGLGTPYAVAFYSAKTRPGHRDAGMAIARRLFPVLAAISIAFFLAFVLGSRDTVDVGVGVIMVMVLWVVLFLAAELFKRSAQGHGHMGVFNLANLLSGAVPAVGIVFLAVLSILTVQSTIVIYTITLAFAFIYLVRWGTADGASGGPDDAAEIAELKKPFWRYSVWSMVSVLAVKGNRSFDLLLLSLAGAAADIGYYAVAATSALTVAIVGESLGLHLFQRVARESDADVQERLVVRYLLATVGLSALVGLVFWLLAPSLIPLVYGSDFSPAVTPARILVVGGLLVSSSRLLGEVLKAKGSPRAVAASEFVGAALTLAGLLIWGVESLTAVAWVAVAGYGATAVIEILLTGRAFRWQGTRK
jgi:O-antigen/teichoic acid export membrane protein